MNRLVPPVNIISRMNELAGVKAAYDSQLRCTHIRASPMATAIASKASTKALATLVTLVLRASTSSRCLGNSPSSPFPLTIATIPCKPSLELAVRISAEGPIVLLCLIRAVHLGAFEEILITSLPSPTERPTSSVESPTSSGISSSNRTQPHSSQ